MTFAEKARKEHPKLCDQVLGYPTMDCPHNVLFRYCENPGDSYCNSHSCRQCWEREFPEEKPETIPTQEQLSEFLWNKYVAFQEAGFDKAQAFDLTKLEYEAMLEEIYKKPKR